MIHHLTPDLIAVVVPQGAKNFGIYNEHDGTYMYHYLNGTSQTAKIKLPWPAVIVGMLAECLLDEERAEQITPARWGGLNNLQWQHATSRLAELVETIPALKDTSGIPLVLRKEGERV